MKRFLLAALAATVAAGAYAQVDVVKAAERAMKEKKDASEVVNIITPAFTDPETAEQAITWYIPGKASYAEYDNLLGLKQFNRLPEGGDAKMGKLLISGYNYFMKALPLDSLPDAKGKIKPKYSREIVGTLAGHYTDYVDAGANLYNAQDYMGAYDAWEIFTSMPNMEALQGKITQHADSVYGEIYFNQGIAAWQCDSLNLALNSFMNAKNKGYKKKNMFDYAISIASQLGDSVAVLDLSQEALPLYGQESDLYITQIINYYLQARDFDRAFQILNDAIANDPNNAAYYVIQGVLHENNDNKEAAIESYKKAIELDPSNAKALYYLGRLICDKAFVAADSAPTTEAEYIPYAAANITPHFEEAAGILERAYESSAADPDSTLTPDILNYLENVYYNLQDETKLNDVKRRKQLY